MQVTTVANHNESVAPTPASKVTTDQAAQNRDVVQAVKALNSTGLFGEENQLMFARDPVTKRMVVQVVDRATDKVISQIPPEYLLRLSQGKESS